MFKLNVKDLVVFVTGANRKKGIGRALVEEAVKRGAKKVYASARDITTLDDLVAKHTGIVVPVQLDVTNQEQVHRSAVVASDTQVLINNAGKSGYLGCIYQHNEEMVREEFEVNFFGPLHLMHAFSRNIINNGNGGIVNIISIGAFMSFPRSATYCASKAALSSLTQAARIEMSQHGIPVFGVYPGPIDTDMAEGLNVNKESSANVANRVFDGMEKGIQDITTDPLADAFENYLKKDPKAMDAVWKEFGQGNHH